ncbi:NUDIX domain-containing protein [Candidatus Woesearchaeota archaeon]|nr:NUDIX domain-containing protein [Candidatus Woesearchaeota archaeon]
MKEVSAGAIIFRIDEKAKKPRYLLLHYGSGHWDFIKGHIEGNETEEETLRREAREESGLTDLRIISGFREKVSYFYRKEGETVPKDVIFLLAKTSSAEKEVKLSFEHSEYVWLGFEDAVKKVTYSNSKEVLKKADSFLKKFQRQRRLSE